MNKYFLMSRMIVPGSQYWNQIHGLTREDALKDKEGLQTMRTLARQTAWILKCLDAGKKAGLPQPLQEPWIPTHFIQNT